MKFKKIIRFTESLILFIGILFIIKYISGVIEKDTFRSYENIEELKRNLDDILIPAYIPEFLAWPPSRIIGQKRPYRAMAIELRDKKNNISLILIESEKKDFRLESLYLKEVTETLHHKIKGREATLRIGRCSSIEALTPQELICSELIWKEERYFVNITIRSRPFELIKIAESMMH